MIITYAPKAENDLLEMLRYGYLHWGYDRAVTFIDNFKDSLEILTHHPGIGRVWSVDNINIAEAELRVLNKGHYQVIYEIRPDEIWINTIIPKGRP